eukprot:COSAG01_NODE_68_length_28978_cov_182.027777_24_plen_117_part_00
MSRKKDQNGISYPRMTLIGILEFEKGTKLEYSDPNWNSWGWKAQIGISPLFYSSRIGNPFPKRVLIRKKPAWLHGDPQLAVGAMMWPAAAGWLSLPRQMAIPPTFGSRADIPIRLA